MSIPNQEMEKLVKAAVQKELEEIQKSQTISTKDKKKSKIPDPRSSKDCWRCMGQHLPKASGNRWGRWEECERCAYRLSYTPTKGSPAESIHMPLPSNVTAALAHLRTEGFQAQDCTNRVVKNAIKYVVSQESLKSAKSSTNTLKDKTKGYQTKLEKRASSAAEEIPIHSDDDKDSFQVIQNEKKNKGPTMSTP
jgi:hypothetical protein